MFFFLKHCFFKHWLVLKHCFKDIYNMRAISIVHSGTPEELPTCGRCNMKGFAIGSVSRKTNDRPRIQPLTVDEVVAIGEHGKDVSDALCHRVSQRLSWRGVLVCFPWGKHTSTPRQERDRQYFFDFELFFLSKYWKMNFSIFDVYLSKTCSMLFHHLLKSTLEAKNRPRSAQELLFADCYALGNPFWCNCCGAFWKLENMDFDNPCMAFESFQPPTALHVSKIFRW